MDDPTPGPPVFHNRFGADATGASRTRATERCFQQPGSGVRFHSERQDTSSAGWRRLLELIDEATHGLTRMRITSFDGLLIDLVEREGADCIVRGIRAVSDFEYEFQMALMNRKLRGTVETVFMMPHERYTYISARLIKEVASLGSPVTGLVPPVVETRLTERFSRKQG